MTIALQRIQTALDASSLAEAVFAVVVDWTAEALPFYFAALHHRNLSHLSVFFCTNGVCDDDDVFFHDDDALVFHLYDHYVYANDGKILIDDASY